MSQPIHGNGVVQGDYGPIRVASKPATNSSHNDELPKAFAGPVVQTAKGLSVNATSGVPTVEDGPRHRKEGSHG